MSPRLWLAGAVVLALFTYGRSLYNGFVWDDPIVLDQLRAFRSATDFVVMPEVVPKFYYRPLVFASLAIDRALGGETPALFHLSNIVLHALNTFLVGRLLLAWPGLPAELAAAGTLLFAVHPAHTESVAWISGRSDLLATMFVLFACPVTLRRNRGLQLGAVPALYFAALLAKEISVALLLLLPVLDRLRRQRWHWQRDLAIWAFTAGYFFLRAANVGQALGGNERPGDGSTVVADIVRALGVYVAHAFLPGLVNPYMPDVPSHGAYVLALAAALGALGTLALRSARLWQHPWMPLCLWFAAFLLPATFVIVRQSASTLLADRYLYLPSVASCALTTGALWAMARKLRAPQGTFHLLMGVLLLFSVIRSYQLVPVWQSNASFWTAAVASAPLDPVASRELGLALLELGQTKEARRHLESALQHARSPEEKAMAASGLASLHRRTGEVDTALVLLRQALSAAPHPALYHNLGLTEMMAAELAQRRGKTTAVASHVANAREAFLAALQYETSEHFSTYRTLWDPAKTHALLGQVLFSLGEREAARQHLATALRLAPSGPVAQTTRQYWQQVFPGDPLP